MIQLIEKGSMSWNDETGDFRECILFFTSNLEREKVVAAKERFIAGHKGPREKALQDPDLTKEIWDVLSNPENHKSLSREFCSKMHRPLVYNTLQAKDIIDISESALLSFAKQNEIRLTHLSPSYLVYLAEKFSNNPEGVRPLKRYVEEIFTEIFERVDDKKKEYSLEWENESPVLKEKTGSLPQDYKEKALNEYNVRLKKPKFIINNELLRKELSQVKGQGEIIEVLERIFFLWSHTPVHQRPLSLFFVGTSGVGKTFSAGKIQKAMESHGFGYLEFSMIEFQSEHDYSKIIGSPPGYVGSPTRPVLFDHLKKHKRLVICFDELERAHEKVIQGLMQLLDKGKLSWNNEEGDFKECIIIFTSNLEQEKVVMAKNKTVAEYEGNKTEALISSTLKTAIKSIFLRSKLREILTDAFWNRINYFLVFNPLDALSVIQIAIQEIVKMAHEYNLKVGYISPHYLGYIARLYAGNISGARDMKGQLEQDVRETLIPAGYDTVDNADPFYGLEWENKQMKLFVVKDPTDRMQLEQQAMAYYEEQKQK
jgi:ATP-dependent Clp protease ATP-binding subunit ClpA